MKKKVNVFPGIDKNVHKVWHEFCDYMKRWYFRYNYGWIVRKGKLIKHLGDTVTERYRE